MPGHPFDSQTVESGHDGPTLCIVGGVHGNEPAGVDAIEHLREELASTGKLEKGRVVTIIANTRACREGKRAISADLNRCFGNSEATGHEATLARQLAAELAGADYVLDLHSTTSEGSVFGAGARSREHAAFCRAVGVDIYSFGWAKPRGYSMLVDEADRAGAVGLLVECGQHDALSTRSRAIECGRRAMAWLEMTGEAVASSAPLRLASVTEIVKARTAFRFHRRYLNFERVPKGEVVGVDGERPWSARCEFIILIPAGSWARAGEDAFAVAQWVDEI